MRYAKVALDQAIDRLLDYEIPKELQQTLEVGMRVVVPVKETLRNATVWSIQDSTPFAFVKQIAHVATESSVITKDLAQLAEWISSYYAAPLSLVLTYMLPKHIRSHEKEPVELAAKKCIEEEKGKELLMQLRKKAPKQAALFSLILEQQSLTPLRLLLQKVQGTKTLADALVKKGAITLLEIPKQFSWDFPVEYFQTPAKILSEEQGLCFAKIEASIEKEEFASHLIYGVTGSGKTEIYLQAIEKCLKKSKGVIFLVPEIALATQTIERLKSRFAETVAILHHRLSDREKKENWNAIHRKEARIIVGARSAIFSPIPNLGLIIVDEEHDPAYKQMDRAPLYHGKDVAIMRGKFAKATVILGSATPSLESYQNALLGKHILSTLTKRPGSALLPEIHIVDMAIENAKQKNKALFSDKLLSAIKKRLSLGEQTLLLLNRRGYHTAQVCPSCMEAVKCPHCDAVLIYHRCKHALCCHLCGYETSPAQTCGGCKSGIPMKFKGAGTQMAEKALQAIFPSSRILRMDADTTTKKDGHADLFTQFRSGKADILIGTQMIAKGLHFPSVTLVGVLDADITLSIPDFRASEALFQLVTQVAGRAGRSDLPGEVFIQTLLPQQPTLLLAKEQNYEKFFHDEIKTRSLFGFPPFTHLIKIIFSGLNESLVEAKAKASREELISTLSASFTIFPVVPCGHAKIENHYRFQFLIKTTKPLAASKALSHLHKKFHSGTIRVTIDVDPTSTFF